MTSLRAIAAMQYRAFLNSMRRGGKRDPLSTAMSLKALGVRIEPVVEADAFAAAAIWSDDSSLSLGDRCCLALARRLNVRAVTADQRWGLLNADVLLIR